MIIIDGQRIQCDVFFFNSLLLSYISSSKRKKKYLFICIRLESAMLLFFHFTKIAIENKSLLNIMWCLCFFNLNRKNLMYEEEKYKKGKFVSSDLFLTFNTFFLLYHISGSSIIKSIFSVYIS